MRLTLLSKQTEQQRRLRIYVASGGGGGPISALPAAGRRAPHANEVRSRASWRRAAYRQLAIARADKQTLSSAAKPAGAQIDSRRREGRANLHHYRARDCPNGAGAKPISLAALQRRTCALVESNRVAQSAGAATKRATRATRCQLAAEATAASSANWTNKHAADRTARVSLQSRIAKLRLLPHGHLCPSPAEEAASFSASSSFEEMGKQ